MKGESIRDYAAFAIAFSSIILSVGGVKLMMKSVEKPHTGLTYVGVGWLVAALGWLSMHLLASLMNM